MKAQALSVMLVLSLLALQASAASQQQLLTSFLGNYVSNSVAANAVIIANGVIGTNSYLFVQINSTFQVVVNTTPTVDGRWHFADSNATIYQVIKPYLISTYYPSNSAIVNLTTWLNADISSTMRQYSGALADCLQLTGAWLYRCSPGAANITTCVDNTCVRVTNCGGPGNKNSLLYSSGINSQAMASVQNLSVYYYIINTSYTKFLNAVNSNTINQTNIGSRIVTAQAALVNITKYSGLISINPLMSPPKGFNFGGCPNPPGSGGFPCDAIGYCPMNSTLGFNWTALNNIKTSLNQLSALPISFTSINAQANLDNASQDSLEDPAEYQIGLAQFQQTLSQTFNSYTALTLNMSGVLAHYSNTMVSSALANVSTVYGNVLKYNVNQNFTTANKTLSLAISNAMMAYQIGASRYLQLYGLALNNTNFILVNELDYVPQKVPASTLSLAASETALNQQLYGKLNDTQVNQLLLSAMQINQQAKGLSQPFSPTALTKWIYGGVVNMMLAGSSQPIASKLAVAPAYTAVIDLVIALIVVGIIYELTYAKLKKHGKLRLTPSVRKVWTIIFAVLILLAFADAYLAYTYAQNANNYLPVSGFLGLLNGQNTAFVGLTSSNQSLTQCAASIQSVLNKKKVYVVAIGSNNTCTYPGGSINGSACYNKIIANNPLILLTQDTNSSITYKGMYGYVLQVNSTFASGPSCPISTMIKVV